MDVQSRLAEFNSKVEDIRHATKQKDKDAVLEAFYNLQGFCMVNGLWYALHRSAYWRSAVRHAEACFRTKFDRAALADMNGVLRFFQYPKPDEYCFYFVEDAPAFVPMQKVLVKAGFYAGNLILYEDTKADVEYPADAWRFGEYVSSLDAQHHYGVNVPDKGLLWLAGSELLAQHAIQPALIAAGLTEEHTDILECTADHASVLFFDRATFETQVRQHVGYGDYAYDGAHLGTNVVYYRKKK